MTYAVILKHLREGVLQEIVLEFFDNLEDAVAWRDRRGNPLLKVFRVEPVVDVEPHPGETWRWPTSCEACLGDIGPWNPDIPGSPMTHIVAGGGPDWDRNRDHEPVLPS